MTITDREEMRSSILTKMWKDEVRVLVDFVGILRTVAGLCGKWELGNAVIELFLGLRTLSWLRNWLWCSYLTSNWRSKLFVITTSTIIPLLQASVMPFFRRHLTPLIIWLTSTWRCRVKVWQSDGFLFLAWIFAWLRGLNRLIWSLVHVQGTVSFSLHILFPDLNWFWRVY